MTKKKIAVYLCAVLVATAVLVGIARADDGGSYDKTVAPIERGNR